MTHFNLPVSQVITDEGFVYERGRLQGTCFKYFDPSSDALGCDASADVGRPGTRPISVSGQIIGLSLQGRALQSTSVTGPPWRFFTLPRRHLCQLHSSSSCSRGLPA